MVLHGLDCLILVFVFLIRYWYVTFVNSIVDIVIMFMFFSENGPFYLDLQAEKHMILRKTFLDCIHSYFSSDVADCDPQGLLCTCIPGR